MSINNQAKFNHKDFHTLKNQLNNLITQDNEYKNLKDSGERVNPMQFIRKNEKKFNTIWNKFRQNTNGMENTDNFDLPKDGEKDDLLKDKDEQLTSNISVKDTQQNNIINNNLNSDKLSEKKTSNKLKDNSNKDTIKDNNKNSVSKENKDDKVKIKNDELIGVNGLNSDSGNNEDMKGVHSLGRFKQLDDGVMRVINY